MFRARLPSIFITSHKMPRLPRNLHAVTTWRSPDNAICKGHAARHVWSAAPAACHAKGPWRSPKNATHLLKTKSTAPNATSSEHTLNPQTPRVKREPLLRIQKKHLASNNHGTRFSWLLTYVQVRMNRPPHEQRVNVIFRLPGIYTPQEKLKDRIAPQGNFFQYWAPNVVAGTGKEGKTKEVVEDREVKQSCVCDQVVCERWCVTKKDGVCACVWQSCVWKMVCVKVVCERERVTKLCVKDGVSKMVCDKVGCERWCVKDGVWQRWCVKEGVSKMVWWKMVCVTKWCVKDGVAKDGEKSGVWKMVCDGVWKMVCHKVVCEWWCVKDGGWQSGVWKMVCDKVEGQPWCVTKLCVKDGVSKMVGDKVVCERWCVKDVVWQSWVWKMVCDKDGVCERGCVKDGVWKIVCDKAVCERWCVTKMVCDSRASPVP